MKDKQPSPESSKKPPPLTRFNKKREEAATTTGIHNKTTLDTVEMDATIEPLTRRSLLENGIDPTQFVWHIPVSAMVLASGVELEGGVLASMDSDTLHLFRYAPKDGFQLANFAVDQLILRASVDDQQVSLEFSVSDSPVSTFEIGLDRACVGGASGPWFEVLKPAFAAVLDIDAEAPIGICSIKLVAPQPNGFGVCCLQETEFAVIHIDEQAVRTLPELKISNTARLIGWRFSDAGATIRYSDRGRPILLTIGRDKGSWRLSIILKGILEQLPKDLQNPDLAEEELKLLGEFIPSANRAADRAATILKRVDNAVCVYDDPESPLFHGFMPFAPDIAVLMDETGKSLGLRIDPKIAAGLFNFLPYVPELLPDDSGNQWGLALVGEQPVRFTIEADSFTIGDRTIPVSATGDIHVANTKEELCEVTLNWTDDKKPVELVLTMHHHIAFQFWEEWDVKRAAAGMVQAGPAELYRQFNQAKKHNMLLVMFGDVLLLNRALDADITMKDLIAQMESTGAVKFAEDDKLRDATVAKILLLTSTLTAIKQKFELLATMAPYYWAQEEARWLSSVFGAEAVSACAVQERKRIVPLVRRQIRVSHSDMMRSLAQIEVAARPLEAIFAREEIQQHWSSKVRQYLPAAVQGTIGGAILASSGGTMGWQLVGGAVATHGMGGIFSVFQRDREAAAEVRRAAEVIFPWWQVFMRTLVVSIFEASEFMDQENERAMTRDKRLLDSTGEKRNEFETRLQEQLRKRILDERRNRFAEIIDGTGVRLAEVVDDIEKAIGPEMREGVEYFSQTLVAVGKKHELKETEDD